TQLFPATSPPPRQYAAAATLNGNVVLFGGSNGNAGPSAFLNDTWEWDGTNWTQFSPATSPPPREGPSAGTIDGTMVLFGGDNSTGFIGDTWQWNGATWTQLSPANSPPGRSTGTLNTL
ncbi:MAG: kelch repeat-containing protein, partial [Polyangiaceae bacterium]